MPRPLPELDARDREILAAFRDHEAPPPGAAERVYDRVIARVDEAFGLAPEPGVPWVRSIAISVAIAAAVLLSIRGVVTGAAALRESADAPPTQAQHEGAPAPVEGHAQVANPAKPTPARARRVEAIPPTGDDATAAPAPEPEAAEPIAPRARDVRARAPADDASTLARDLELLAKAKRTSDAGARLALLEQHRREHPRSTLTEEREVLTIETLCALGRTKDAKVKAKGFAERHPSSAFNARVARSCAGGRG